MSSRVNNIISWIAIFFILFFIYLFFRLGMIEKKITNSLISDSDKIIISIAGFEKDKKLQDKNLEDLFGKIDQRFHPALISIQGKDNKILKTGKDDRFIRSAKIFDSIINSFLKNEFNTVKKNDIFVRYYDASRFYILTRNITGGKVLFVFPYRLSLKLKTQLALEIILLLIASLLIASLFFVYKNRKRRELKPAPEKHINTEKTRNRPAIKSNKTDEIRVIKKENHLSHLSADSLSDDVFDLFRYISEKYNPEKIFLYVANGLRLSKIFELKGKAFIRSTDDVYPVEIKQEIFDELKNSSIILTDKGKNLFTSIIYKNNLIGAIEISGNTQFKGPEINDIKTHFDTLSESLNNYITAVGITV